MGIAMRVVGWGGGGCSVRRLRSARGMHGREAYYRKMERNHCEEEFWGEGRAMCLFYIGSGEGLTPWREPGGLAWSSN